jgi:hypothetical protein
VLPVLCNINLNAVIKGSVLNVLLGHSFPVKWSLALHFVAFFIFVGLQCTGIHTVGWMDLPSQDQRLKIVESCRTHVSVEKGTLSSRRELLPNSPSRQSRRERIETCSGLVAEVEVQLWPVVIEENCLPEYFISSTGNSSEASCEGGYV